MNRIAQEEPGSGAAAGLAPIQILSRHGLWLRSNDVFNRSLPRELLRLQRFRDRAIHSR